MPSALIWQVDLWWQQAIATFLEEKGFTVSESTHESYEEWALGHGYDLIILTLAVEEADVDFVAKMIRSALSIRDQTHARVIFTSVAHASIFTEGIVTLGLTGRAEFFDELAKNIFEAAS